MSPNLRLIRIPTLTVIACLALGALAVSGSPASASSSLGLYHQACPYPENLPDGSGYYREVLATHVTCAYTKGFIRAYWKCRTNSGKTKTGTCRTRVQGFKCTDKHTLDNKVEGTIVDFEATANCRRGNQKIVIRYQQRLHEEG